MGRAVKATGRGRRVVSPKLTRCRDRESIFLEVNLFNEFGFLFKESLACQGTDISQGWK